MLGLPRLKRKYLKLLAQLLLLLVENKIPSVSDVVKEAVFDTNILDIEAKHFTTFDDNNFTENMLNIKKKEKRLFDYGVDKLS